MAFSFTLADNTRVRYATGAIMYFAQGIPQGLLAIATPVWLVSQGVGAGDIGDAKIGKQSNAMDSYQCPRCSGAMVKVVDPKQTHIWYETCSSCHGSYLDAGELRDLSDVSISDFFKSFATPERK